MIFYHFYVVVFFPHVYSPRQGQTTHWGQNFDVNRNVLSLHSFVASLKKCLWSLIFYRFFMCFYHMYIAPGRGSQPIGDKKFMTTERPYVAIFKMISSKSDFIHIFNGFIHVYSPGARVENILGTNLWCQQKALITATISCKFQINVFEFWFYTHFLMFFHMYIYRTGAGADNPLWTKS